ncbi:hypothetical protein ACFQHV_13415 [Promicromonospora thailandica]|uniref:Uncharacterized protein n=1 Tax=Promicromonospora thailandica TaxID=765201 RepID=A0A9X2JXT6_9MICO|nr:hypothetical protein [Promicromonospora thailandica]MCP2266912.1 hypothetical protein [Promicromonospora thailandica]BFF16582.1 hypothetical protein GCM10025730_01030 [Promicromonospora thailandica]
MINATPTLLTCTATTAEQRTHATTWWITGRPAAGVLVALLDVVAAVLVFFMTWFSVGPGSLVGLWLLLAAAVLGFEPGIRRRLAVVGLVVVGATLVAGSGVLLHVPALAVPVALALNVGAVVYLSRLAARRPLPRRRSSV